MLFALSNSTIWGQFIFDEDFKGTTADGWIFGTQNGGYTPELTAREGIDQDGDGWLRLTTNGGNQSNFAYLDNTFSAANNEVKVTIDFTIWGGNGADGLTFFLYDGDQAFDTGAFGGSLGYANRSGVDGVAGGYLSVGLDTYGNYSNPTEGRNGGVGFNPDQIVVRGPGNGQNGYEYLAGTNGINTTIPDDPFTPEDESTIDSLGVDLQFNARPETGTATQNNYFTVEILLTTADLLTVRFDDNPADGLNLTDLFTVDMSSFDRPENFGFGFTASTGGLNNYHEIRNLEITTTTDPVLPPTPDFFYWDNGINNGLNGDSLWSTATNWDGAPGNTDPDSVPPVQADIIFDSTYVSTNQSIDLDGDREVHSITFDDNNAYTLEANGDELTFANDQNPGDAFIRVESSSSAEHTIETDIDLETDLVVDNNGTGNVGLTLDGDIAINNNTLTFDGTGTTEVLEDIRGTGDFVKQGQGTVILDANDNDFSGDAIIKQGTVIANPNNNRIHFGNNSNNRNVLGSGDVILDGGNFQASTTGNQDIRFYQDFTVQNGSVGTLDSDDDFSFQGGSVTTVDNGTLNLIADDDTIMSGSATWTVSNDGRINISGTGGGSRTRLDGTVNLNSGGTIFSDAPDTELDNGLTINGDANGNNGLLAITGDLRVENITVNNRFDLTIDADQDTVIETDGNNRALNGVGTLLVDNDGNTLTVQTQITQINAEVLDVRGGTILFTDDDQFRNNTTDVILSGGATIDTNGSDQQFASLTMNSSSIIDLGEGGSILEFSQSDTNSWDGELAIVNWDGRYTTGGGSDQIIFGSNVNGLDASQIDRIRFYNPEGLAPGIYGAQILSNGEIVPTATPVPEPGTVIGAIALLALAAFRERKRWLPLLKKD